VLNLLRLFATLGEKIWGQVISLPYHFPDGWAGILFFFLAQTLSNQQGEKKGEGQ